MEVALRDGLEKLGGIELEMDPARIVGRSKGHAEQSRIAVLGPADDIRQWELPTQARHREIDVTLATLSIHRSGQQEALVLDFSRERMESDFDDQHRRELTILARHIDGVPARRPSATTLKLVGQVGSHTLMVS
jgi:hypothetical protein